MPSHFLTSIAAAAAIGLASCGQQAQPPADISVTDAWARATVAGQPSAAAYMTITNNGHGSDRLIRVSSSIAGQATLHSTSNEGGVMRMRALMDGLEIPASGAVALKPGGAHAMLNHLSVPLAVGGSFPLTLKFERSGDRQVTVRVLDPATAGGSMEGM